MMRIYGLKACDTCRKALKSLQGAGLEAEFVDVRAAPLGREKLAELFEALGDDLINTRSTTWRGLSAAERAAAPLDLLCDHPALMKRPVIETGAALTLGWSKAVQAQYGV